MWLQVLPDHSVKQKISNLMVKCKNYQDGCAWNGTFQALMVGTCIYGKLYIIYST